MLRPKPSLETKSRTAGGFTLVELLVVIGIIAVLIGILMPVLSRAREQANAMKCAANLRSVGQGFAMYLAENKGVYPLAYLYKVGPGSQSIKGTAISREYGYIHWSHFIYGEGRTPADAFVCPSLPNEGGLPPTNPRSGDEVSGQKAEYPGVVDDQVRRCAYTLNEAVIPRNKFSQGALKVAGHGNGFDNQHVRATRVRKSSEIILATEFWEHWQLISDSQAGDDTIVKSHRSVHAFKVLQNAGEEWNLSSIAGNVKGSGSPPVARESSAAPDPLKGHNGSRLNWIGRNHGTGKVEQKKTNFLYCDGHVELKTIEDTLRSPKYQWGEVVYSVVGEPAVYNP